MKHNRSMLAWIVSLICTLISPVAAAQKFASLDDLSNRSGVSPFLMSLVQGTDGNLYGTTNRGGAYGYGTVFRITPSGALTTLHNFNGNDGSAPVAGLLQALDGNLYGTTTTGGSSNSGTVFKITPSGIFTTIHSLNFTNGTTPVGALIQGVDGDFYGTASSGGVSGGGGTVFKITAEGKVTRLYTFCFQRQCADGDAPAAGLVQGQDGNFYGTTVYGGDAHGFTCAGGCGTIFKITPEGRRTTLYAFCIESLCADGAFPYAPLVLAGDGSFYGTTVSGGTSDECADGCGTVFRVTAEGDLTTLYSFCAQAACLDGGAPYSGVVQATDGNFYGTTELGGALSEGTVYELTSGGELTVLHNFDGGPKGATPIGGVTQETRGVFYGTTLEGGVGRQGTIFGLDTNLGPFVAFVRPFGKVGQTGGILGQGFTGTTSVMLNGIPANFTVVSDTFIRATVPPGATTGYVTVTAPMGVLTSNVPFHVLP